MPISLFPNAQDFQAPASGTLVVIGNFDGVHRGHVAILRRAVELSERLGLAPVLLTFHPHPAEVLGRGKLPQLTSLSSKAELIARVSPTIAVVAHPFTLELSQKSPEQFASELLFGLLGAKRVMVGENFEFGKNRSGKFKDLVALGEKFGFVAEAVALSGDDGGIFSSSRVRQALEAGNVQEVSRVLGRYHTLSGTVVRGQGRAQALGFPTANLAEVAEALPRLGVYAVFVEELTASGPRAIGPGVANVGVRPTLGAGFSVEAHILDFRGDLYGEKLRLGLVEGLREEQKFSSLEALVAQVQQDLKHARGILANYSGLGAA